MAVPAYVQLLALAGAGVLVLRGSSRAWWVGVLLGLALYGCVLVDEVVSFADRAHIGTAGWQRLTLGLARKLEQPSHLSHLIAACTWALAGAGVTTWRTP